MEFIQIIIFLDNFSAQIDTFGSKAKTTEDVIKMYLRSVAYEIP